jgi:hypothetical protein
MIIIAGSVCAASLGLSSHNASKKSLVARANTIAQLIAIKDIQGLSASERDLENPAYSQIKDRFIALRDVNPDTRFIYLSGEKNGKVFFYVDSEDPQSPDYSPPGQQYGEASSLMRQLFKEKTSGFEIAGDRWGLWASVMVPIIDPETGNTLALLGIDVSADDYVRNIVAYILAALLLAAFIMTLFISQHRIVRNLRMTQESLEAKNLELMRMNELLSKRELKLDEMEGEMREIKESLRIK